MDPAGPQDTEAAIAALLHAIASPLGAIANYAHLLPPDTAPEARTGILASMTRARQLLQEGQAWLDALELARAAAPAEGLDLVPLLADAAARAPAPVHVEAAALPRVAVPGGAAARLLDAVLADAADAAGAAPATLRVTLAGRDPVHFAIAQADRRWSESEAAAAFDLFARRPAGSNAAGGLPVAGALARRLGGRAWGAVAEDGTALLHLVLPAARGASDPAGETTTP